MNIPCVMGLVADTRRGKAYESGEIKENVSWKIGRGERKKRKRHTKAAKLRELLARFLGLT